MPDSPYKFLSHYRLEDEKIFKGRGRETSTLVSDIVTKRLVVLFAKTGTGKTSLINAGVRPRLHERAYATCFVRVSRDPAESARRELAAQFGVDTGGGALAPHVQQLVGRLGQPLVLFFDQFEEFFVYTGGRSERGRRFISDAAALYNNKMSGVHLVFSMREELLYEMDHFRDEIPTIFHKDSTLRLRGFDREQAREAIQLPAAEFGCEVADDLTERLLDELAETSQAAAHGDVEIEPTQLQIVCDALWQKRAGDRITLEDYLKLGRAAGDDENIARRILDRRIEDEFESITSPELLRLAERLLPELRTEDDTKRVRDFEDLAQSLGASRELLDQLVTQLERARLVQRDKRESTLLVELSHDYLAAAARIGRWQRKIRGLWLRAVQRRHSVLPPDDLGRVLEGLSGYDLSREQAYFLFRSSLAHGLDMRRYFELALEHGVGVWNVLRQMVTSRNTSEALNPIDLLRELQTPQAVELLEVALNRKELAAEAQAALGVAARSRNSEVSSRAQNALRRLALSAPQDAPSGEGPRRGVEGVSDEPSAEGSRRVPLAPPYPVIRDALEAGYVIPFLGPGASLSGRQPRETWSEGSKFLPTGQELAQHLARRAAFPKGEALELTKVAQYFSEVAGREVLEDELRRVFDRDYRPALLHEFLAGVSKPLLIVTTNFDNLVERAFDAAARPYDLVIQTDDTAAADTILWRPHGKPDFVSTLPNQLTINLYSTTVVYKMLGSAVRSHGGVGQYVITEDDYIDYLARMNRNRAIPTVFVEPLQTRPFLFLGYSLRDWFLRTMLSSIEKNLRRSKRVQSWAVQPRATPLERDFWRARRVEPYEMEIEEFVRGLISEGKADA